MSMRHIVVRAGFKKTCGCEALECGLHLHLVISTLPTCWTRCGMLNCPRAVCVSKSGCGRNPARPLYLNSWSFFTEHMTGLRPQPQLAGTGNEIDVAD